MRLLLIDSRQIFVLLVTGGTLLPPTLYLILLPKEGL